MDNPTLRTSAQSQVVYRKRVRESLLEKVIRWAEKKNSA